MQETKEKADFVIAYIHWGTEYSETLETAQTEGARELIDAGADVVLGAHPHCLQGMEYYNGKPILYSLGNYWFNEKTLDTILAELHFYGNDEEQHLEVTGRSGQTGSTLYEASDRTSGSRNMEQTCGEYGASYNKDR